METVMSMFAATAAETTASTVALTASEAAQEAVSSAILGDAFDIPSLFAEAAPAGFQWGLRETVGLGAMGLMVGGGFGRAAQLRGQANFEAFNARSEEIAGLQAANEARARLLKNLAAQNAAFGASGVELSSGTPQDVMAETRSDGERELSTLRDRTIMSAGGRRMQADMLRGSALGAVTGGFANAAGTLFDYVDRRDRIGRIPERRR